MAKIKSQVGLKQELGLWQVTFAGVGIILGAGIYALIGVASESGGNALWISFLFSAIAAAFTGFCYAELSSFFKGDAGEFDYCRSSFGKKFAYLIAIIMIFTGIVSASTVALGFAGYLVRLVDFNYLGAGFLIVILMSFLSYYGIKESNRFNIFSAIAEIAGLIFIILIGIPKWGSVDLLEMPMGFSGVMEAGALVFFSFLGFEMVVKLRDETRDPDTTIPRALLLSILITTVIYILVAVSAVSVFGYEALSQSSSPLADVAKIALGQNAFVVIAIIALFSTANTVLISLLTTSRMLYGMAKENSLPRFLAKVHQKRRTPHFAILVTFVLAALFLMIGDMRFIAIVTNVLLLVTFIAVDLSAIILRYKNTTNRPYKMPLNIGRFPLLALFGILVSAVLLFYSLQDLFL